MPTQSAAARFRFALLVLLLSIGAGVLAWAPWSAPAASTDADQDQTSPTPAADPQPTVSPVPTPEVVPDPVVFTIGGVGDVLPHDTPIRKAHLGGDDYDFTPMLEATRPWSEGVDLAICNMEVPLSKPGEVPSGYPRFGAPRQIVANLAGLGWDGCSTGTNHTIDRGADNAEYTLDIFDENGLGHAGSARSQDEADAPQFYELEREGQTVTVAQIGATFGTNGLPIPTDKPWVVDLLDADRLTALATQARADGADLVVATLHWGEEYTTTPVPSQTSLAAKLAASGEIDLILGSHPHVPMPFAKLDGGPGGDGMWVAYSLGNFISNQDSNCCVVETATGLFATVTVEKPADGPARVTGMEWTPITVDRLGEQRAYPLRDVIAERPTGLTLSESTLTDRLNRVVAVMERSTGADFAERTEPPTPTGPKPVVIPRVE